MKIFSSKSLYECFTSISKKKPKQFDKFKELYFIFDENYWFSMAKHPEFIYNFTVKNQIKFEELKGNLHYFFEPVTREFTDDERNKLKKQISLTSKKITKQPILTLVYQEFMCIANFSKFKSELNNIRTCSSAWGFDNLIYTFLRETEEMLLIHIRSFFDKRKGSNELNIHKLISLIKEAYDLNNENNKLLLSIYEDLNKLVNVFETNKYWDSISKDIAHFQTTDDYENMIKNNFTLNRLFNIFEEIYFYLEILAYLLFKKKVQFKSLYYTELTYEDMFCLNTICASLSIYDVYSKWVKFGANWEIGSYLNEKKASKLSDLNSGELIELENKILEKIKLTNLTRDDLNLLNSNESQYHSHLIGYIREQIIYIMNYFKQILLIKKELFNKSNNK